MKNNIKNLSRILSLVLRHKPETIGIKLHAMGWANTEKLIDGINKKINSVLTKEDLEKIVQDDDKQRFSFNDNKTMIKANQGHTVNIKLKFKKKQPPMFLYHGTSLAFRRDIFTSGKISKMKRHHVHLSEDIETATKIANRHKGINLIIRVYASHMAMKGYKFYVSDNGVWLVDEVPIKYTDLA